MLSPEQLLGRELNDVERRYSPKTLYISGPMRIPIPGPRVAIVGTREPSPEGRKTAYELASSLSRTGINIISGLARGIDTESHKGAISAHGKTMAVLGTPLDMFYPKENQQLQLEIMEKYLAVSQFPSAQPVQRRNFVIRNRTMALLCDASIIVEAGDSSGTLSQGWEALRLGRPLFIWESVFNAHHLKWPAEMISYGAVRFDDISTVLDQLPSGDSPLVVPQW